MGLCVLRSRDFNNDSQYNDGDDGDEEGQEDEEGEESLATAEAK